MMSARIDLRKSCRGGCTTVQYDKDGVRFNSGDWISVDLGSVEFYFDRDDAFLGGLRSSHETKDIVDVTLRRVAELCTPDVIGRIVDAVASAHAKGLIEGREEMAHDVRSLLGIRSANSRTL